jgi:hypothetical protein
VAKKQCLKYDEGKPRWDLLPVYPLEQVARVLTYGVKKYDAENWRKGLSFKRSIGSIKRHLASFETRENIDPESQLHHLAHMICDGMMLLEHTVTHPELDDRAEGVASRDGKVQVKSKR